MKEFFKSNINKIAIIIIAFNLFIYTLLSTTAYADDFVDKPVVTTPSTDLSVVMSPVIGPQQITSEIFSKAAEELVVWETGKLNDILDEQIGADEVLKDYYEVYYDLLVNDYQNILEKYCYGSSKFDSDGSFLEEYTNAYYRHYFKALYQFSEPFDWDIFVEYANERHKSELSGGSTDTVYYINKRGIETRFSAPSVKKVIDDTDIVYYPTGRVNKISWKTDPTLSSSDLDFARLGRVTFLYNGNFFKEKNLTDVYCVLFYYDGSDYFYSQNGFHFYLDNWADSSGESGTSLFYDSFNFFELADVSNENQVFEDINSMPYIDFNIGYSTPYSYYFNGYSEFARYLGNNSNFVTKRSSFSYDSFARFFVKSNSFTDIRDNYLLNYRQSEQFWAVKSRYCSSISVLPVNNVPCDWGFIYSDQKFTMDGFGADIDTSKIPDNYYITVSGDSIYDYSITNPETGQSSTINEYINNNYTYVNNNNPSGGDGTGTTGGDINVSGKVEVDGKVDINVNVSGVGDSGGDPPEIGGVDDLVDYLPEKSPVINEYLKIFFDTLPPELLHLILAGVAVAIIILIFRR